MERGGILGTMRACWLLVLGACGEGIFIEVHRPPGVEADQVALLIAKDPCALYDRDDPGCDGVQPEGLIRKYGSKDDLFFRDALDVFAGEFDDTNLVVFQLDPGDKTLPVVIAVGTIGGQVTSVAVMEDIIDLRRNPIRYRADLEPVEVLGNVDPEPGHTAAIAWPRTAPNLECFGVVTAKGRPLFLLNADDPDCDQVPQPECDPLAFRAVTPTAEHCVTRDPKLMNACVAGSIPCVEDPNNINVGRCLGSPTCMPDAVCTDPCGFDDKACHLTKITGAQTPRITCRFRGEPAGATMQPCSTIPELPLDQLLGVGSCQRAPRFIGLPAAATDPFAIGLDTHDVGGAEFRVEKFVEEPCEISLGWNGTVPNARLTDVLALEVFVRSPTGAPRRMILPATFEIDPVCDPSEAACSLDGAGTSDLVFACTR